MISCTLNKSRPRRCDGDAFFCVSGSFGEAKEQHETWST